VKKLLTFLIFIPIILFSFDYDTQWNSVEKLNKEHLPKSALEKVELIYEEAKTQNNSVQFIRATLYKKNYTTTLNESGQVQAIQVVEKAIKETSNTEEKSLLTSILAQMYQTYYNQNHYKIRQRTKIKETTLKEIETWSSEDFLNKIYKLYQDSLDPQTQNINIEKYKEILSEAKNVDGLRPTLYDLLVFRALAYFQNSSSYLHQVKEFNFKEKNAFSSASNFASLHFDFDDKENFKYQTVKLYQKLLHFYMNKNHLKALEHLNLERLTFVKQNYVGKNGDNHYLEAL